MGSADKVAASTAARGGRAVAMEADLADANVIPSLFDTAEEHFGRGADLGQQRLWVVR